MYLKAKFYDTWNVPRMDRVEVACDACRAKHGLSRGIMVNKEEGSEENEGEEEAFEELIGKTKNKLKNK